MVKSLDSRAANFPKILDRYALSYLKTDTFYAFVFAIIFLYDCINETRVLLEWELSLIIVLRWQRYKC